VPALACLDVRTPSRPRRSTRSLSDGKSSRNQIPSGGTAEAQCAVGRVRPLLILTRSRQDQRTTQFRSARRLRRGRRGERDWNLPLSLSEADPGSRTYAKRRSAIVTDGGSCPAFVVGAVIAVPLNIGCEGPVTNRRA
jgi:hypothetical protein